MDARSHLEMDIPRLSAQRPVPPAVRRLLRGERGFGLVELLVVIPMMAVVLMGIYALYNVGAKGQRQNQDRVASLLRQQNGLERMTREMRQAISFTPVSSQVLDAETYVRPSSGAASAERHVRYECVSGACTRYEGAANGTTFTQSEVVISNVQNADVFFFEPDNVNPTYTAVRLEVQVTGANNPVTLEGGFALRNQTED
jgi:Tfp pilus assembly protein PilW